MPDTDQTFDEWCIVELLGHRRLAGHVTEVQLAGAGFLRIDIPDGQTQFVSPGSVYALHPVTEDVARRFASRTRQEPVQRWELPAVADERPDDPDAQRFDRDEDYDGDEEPF